MINLLKKIWNDPVLSKVIGGIFLAIVFCIPIKIFYKNIIMFCKTLIAILFHYFTFVLIALLSITVVVLFILVINKTKTSKGLAWLKNQINKDINSFYILFWFPVNGILRSNPVRLSSEYKNKIIHSNIINELVHREILIPNWSYLDISYSIDRYCYEYLDNFLKMEKHKIQSTGNQKQEFEKVISIFSSMSFPEIVITYIENSLHLKFTI